MDERDVARQPAPVTDETTDPTSGTLGASGVAGVEVPEPCGMLTAPVFSWMPLDGSLGGGGCSVSGVSGAVTSGSETPASGASGVAGAEAAGSAELVEVSSRPPASRALHSSCPNPDY